MSESNNVIHVDFAETRRRRELGEIVHLVETIAESENVSDIIANELVSELIHGMAHLGYDLTEYPEVVRDIIMVYEATKSMVHRASGDKYFMQENIDQMVKVDDEVGLLDDLLNNFEYDLDLD